MAIEKRSTTKGITYRAIVTQRIDDQRHRITKTFNTKREAKAWELEQTNNIKAGLNVVDMNLTFGFLSNKWLKDVIQHEKSPATYRAFKGDMTTHLLPILSNYKISKIAKNNVSNIRATLSDKKLAKASINRIMATFKSFIN